MLLLSSKFRRCLLLCGQDAVLIEVSAFRSSSDCKVFLAETSKPSMECNRESEASEWKQQMTDRLHASVRAAHSKAACKFSSSLELADVAFRSKAQLAARSNAAAKTIEA